jgi:hypothetical protein
MLSVEVQHILHVLYLWQKCTIVYDNKYASYIDIYFYDSFLWNPNFKRLRFNILDTLFDVLDKCLCFALIKIESVSIFNNQATLGSFSIFCCIYFPIK